MAWICKHCLGEFDFVRLTDEGIRLPVKLDFSSEKIEDTYFPLRRGGRLVYATPGDGEILEPEKF